MLTTTGKTSLINGFDTCEHELIGVVRDGENMGWSLNPLLASVCIHHGSIIHWEPLVGIHSDAEEPRVRLSQKPGYICQYDLTL